MNISSSNYFSVSASTNKGMSGLVSGMDTESMVEQMLSGTQTQIDKQQQLKTQTEWKQEMYREVIDELNAFRNKYFDTAFDSDLKTNFAKDSLFNTMISTVSEGSAVKVISSDSASVGNMNIIVKNLATASVLQGTQKLSGDHKIIGSALTDENLQKTLSKEVVLSVNGQRVEVDLAGVKSMNEMTEAFNAAFADKGIQGVQAKTYNGALRFVSESTSAQITVDSDSSALGLQMAGLSSLNRHNATDEAGNAVGSVFQAGSANLQAGVSFDITFDGITKNINLTDFSQNGDITVDSLLSALQTEVKSAFGDYIKIEKTEEGALSFSCNTASDAGHSITITGSDAYKLGITPGASSLVSMSTKLSELSLTGNRFSFEINGKSFTFSENDTLGTVINTINASSAGVQLRYSSLSDVCTLESTLMGSGNNITISQTEGNLLSYLFGTSADGKPLLEAGSSAVSQVLTTGSIQGTGLDKDYTSTGGSLTMTVNGVKATFTLEEKDSGSYDASTIESQFNAWLASSFGTDGAGKANLSYSNGKLSIAEGFVVSFEAASVDLENGKDIAEAAKTDFALAMGFSTSAKNNIASSDTKIEDILQLKGNTVVAANGQPAQTLGDIAGINGTKVSYAGDGRVKIEGSGALELTGAVKSIFGADELSFGSGLLHQDAVQSGKDATIIINGVETTRNSNTFSVEGLMIQLVGTSPLQENGEYSETVITTERDADALVEAFKGFVDDYNALVEKLHDLVDADDSYKEYPPLTSEQRKEMSDREIELWEEKAKEGLLRRDSILEGVLSSMRLALYQKPDSSAFALYDIGIETASYFSEAGQIGQLTFNETDLRNAIASDPDSVRLLFTDAQEGLASKLISILNGAAKTTGGSKGSLVEMAGVSGTSSEKSNTLYRELQSISERIEQLQDRYESERQRYWDQFNSMETILSNYSAQSSMLSSYFSY